MAMTRVYSSKDPLMIAHLKNVLETFDIRCVAKKFDLSSGAGELPPIECWPELWVEERRAAEAKTILRKTLAPIKAVRKPWRCHRCGEEIEGQFSECWKCGQSRGRSGSRPARVKPAAGSLTRK
ncbi:MAG TPA: DUF2007 domain-containing protein [Candidatus Eisenbacteria bacterium]|nr:DUF2007 domain-containing protein [Candidatus Eisenbacteria bacterium]